MDLSRPTLQKAKVFLICLEEVALGGNNMLIQCSFSSLLLIMYLLKYIDFAYFSLQCRVV
jgi:hypothetical protein